VSPQLGPGVHSGRVSEADIDVLSSEPVGDKPPSREWRSREFAVGVAVITAVALVLGGFVARSWEGSAQPAHTAADEAAVALSAVVTGGLIPSTPESDGSSVSQRIDLALVSSSPMTLNGVVVAWDDVHEAYSYGSSGRAPVGPLQPHRLQRVSLQLNQPCTTPALAGAFAVPHLVVTAVTADGRHRQVNVDPVGMAGTWSAMQAACPEPNPTSVTTVTLTQAQSSGPRSSTFTLTFTNPTNHDILISGIKLTKGSNVSSQQVPSQLQVFPTYTATTTVGLTIKDCKSALQDVEPTTVVYQVASVDEPTKRQPVKATEPAFADAVGELVYRACGRS
jgi:hypothetical protein